MSMKKRSAPLPLIAPYDATHEYHEGVKAYQDGKKVIENPYRYHEADRPKYLQWSKGYNHAKKFDELSRM